MAAGDLAGSFQDEVTCPICLEYFTDPVTVECGHNFCQACLSQCWGESEPNFSCPQCRETILQRHLRPSYQLGNLVELVKRLRLPAGPAPEAQPGCERHQEALKLFCQEDQVPICMICRESRAHRTHMVAPIEEAAQEYKEKLQGALGLLRKQLKKAEALTSKEKEQTTEWQRTVQAKRVTIASEFNKLHALLKEEEQLLLQRLAEEERETLQWLQENVSKLSQQSSSLQQLIAEIEGKCQQPVAELLKDVKSTLSRSENMKLQGPEPISTDLQDGYKICLDLREALNRFAEPWPRASCALVLLAASFLSEVLSGCSSAPDGQTPPSTHLMFPPRCLKMFGSPPASPGAAGHQHCHPEAAAAAAQVSPSQTPQLSLETGAPHTPGFGPVPHSMHGAAVLPQSRSCAQGP
ncbi:E3 ubiquitin-protein ligase TRIM11-like isoform X3 [Pelodiscus sinensis]|uniref:E3 ubiquitin-protein ligase TRIM11-like isoform X3 n=1 Tax=Pelodiscus sinensis TaxID=13735 RepID=UPI003F6B470B